MYNVQHSIKITRHEKSEENMTSNEEKKTGKGCTATADPDIEVS